MASPPQSAGEHFSNVGAAMSQINPEFESHVDVPHSQSTLFGAEPSVMLHDVKLQVLINL